MWSRATAVLALAGCNAIVGVRDTQLVDADLESWLVGTPAAVAPGGDEHVMVHDTAGGRHDWVGLYEVGQLNTGGPATWAYLDGTQQAPAAAVPDAGLTITIPPATTPGQYEWRLQFDDGVSSYSLGATSPAITIGTSASP